MIQRYGSNAGIEAAEHADEHLEKGHLELSATWQRIMTAIEKLQAEKPEPGETVCSRAATPRRGDWPNYQPTMNGDDSARKNGTASIRADGNDERFCRCIDKHAPRHFVSPNLATYLSNTPRISGSSRQIAVSWLTVRR
jgi:hypothetical protein